MPRDIEVHVDEVDGELVIRIGAPAEPADEGGDDDPFEVREPRYVTHVPGFHPEATPV